MSARLRYRAMYATSTAIGWTLAVLLTIMTHRIRGARALIRNTAREHAEAAERKEGPYLAPVTLIAIVLAIIALAVGLLS